MPWPSPPEECWVKLLCEYLLPLAYPGQAGRKTPLSRRFLRCLARLHCWSGIHAGAALEQRAFRRLGMTDLSRTCEE